MSPFPIRSTPFPNALLDTAMPTLKDTEWRILCVIVRQTLGWQGEGPERRKESDWLTHGQLKARTGRSGEAVSHALDALVRRNLVEVRGDRGELLATPADRRRAAGRLSFRLSPQEPDEEAGSIQETEARVSETGIRKAKTTKETSNKRAPGGGASTYASEGGEGSQPIRRREAGADALAPDVRRFLDAYREAFARYSARGEVPPISWGKDGKLVKGLLAQYGYARLVELLERFFQSEDAWVRKRGYALSCLPATLPALLMEDRRSRPVRAEPLVIHTDAPWRRGSDVPVSDASLFERFPDLARKVRGQPP